MTLQRFDRRLADLVAQARDAGLAPDAILDLIDARLEQWRGELLGR